MTKNSKHKNSKSFKITTKMIRVFSIFGLVISAQSFELQSAMAQNTPNSFFEHNMASCFYCDNDQATQPGLQIVTDLTADKRQKEEVKNLLKNPSQNSDQKSELIRANLQKHGMDLDHMGVQKDAPEPFKNMIKAYESGDMQAAYEYATQFVRYKERVMQRSEVLGSMISKARTDVNAEKQVQASVKDILASINPQIRAQESLSKKKIALFYFFDINSSQSELVSNQMQKFFEGTLTQPNLSFQALSTQTVDASQVEEYRNRTEFYAPIRMGSTLVEEFKVSSLPALVALDRNGNILCRVENLVGLEQQQIWNELVNCLSKQETENYAASINAQLSNELNNGSTY